MDEKFQDRIDEYLLGRMSDADKAAFLQEVKQDKEKNEQLEFTKNVKNAICSREEKLDALKDTQAQYEARQRKAALRHTGTESYCIASDGELETSAPKKAKKKTWLWISGIAAILVIGFFAITPMFYTGSSPKGNGMRMEQMRGGDDVFSSAPADSTDTDTMKVEKEKPVAPNE